MENEIYDLWVELCEDGLITGDYAIEIESFKECLGEESSFIT